MNLLYSFKNNGKDLRFNLKSAQNYLNVKLEKLTFYENEESWQTEEIILYINIEHLLEFGKFIKKVIKLINLL